MAIPTSSSSRIASLDGLRGVAAVAVMLFHFNIFFLPQARLTNIVPFLGRAYLAVDLFFLLSGFVMGHVYGRLLASNWRAHWRRFAIARLARIYPLFAIATLALMILVALHNAPTEQISFSGRALVLQPLLLQQWYRDLNWNYPSWSISTEAEAYVLFVFFAGSLISGRRPWLIAACCVVMLMALSVSDGGSLNYFFGVRALLRTLSGFSLGVLLYRADNRRVGLPRSWAGGLAIVLAGLAKLTGMDFLAVCAFACLIYYAVNPMNLLSRILCARPLVALGRWSYSIYLLHAPVHFAVITAFVVGQHPVSQLDLPTSRLLLFTTALAVVGLAAIHYYCVETPLRHLFLRAHSNRYSPDAITN